MSNVLRAVRLAASFGFAVFLLALSAWTRVSSERACLAEAREASEGGCRGWESNPHDSFESQDFKPDFGLRRRSRPINSLAKSFGKSTRLDPTTVTRITRHSFATGTIQGQWDKPPSSVRPLHQSPPARDHSAAHDGRSQAEGWAVTVFIVSSLVGNERRSAVVDDCVARALNRSVAGNLSWTFLQTGSDRDGDGGPVNSESAGSGSPAPDKHGKSVKQPSLSPLSRWWFLLRGLAW